MRKPELKFIASMLIFGSIGIFIKAISLPTPVIVLMRTIIGSAFLITILLLRKKPLDIKHVQQNLPVLSLCGLVLGGGWACLFEAYRLVPVSIATLLYYCAPIVVLLLSPIILKERLTWGKMAGIGAAIIGMVIVNGIGFGGSNLTLGLTCGVVSALLYAALMILNKFVKNLPGLESTLIQLIIAGFVMVVYIFLSHTGSWAFTSWEEVLLLLTVGICHTGLACYLYISSMQELPGQTIALLSYIDPVSALLFSALFLNEKLNQIQILGALLILGGTAFGQMYQTDAHKGLTKSA